MVAWYDILQIYKAIVEFEKARSEERAARPHPSSSIKSKKKGRGGKILKKYFEKGKRNRRS